MRINYLILLYLILYNIPGIYALTPVTGAPEPNTSASIYSFYGYYGEDFGPLAYQSLSGDNIITEQVMIEGNECLKVTKSETGWAGQLIRRADYGTTDLSGYTKLHMHLWNDANTEPVYIFLMYYDSEQPEGNQWIPLQLYNIVSVPDADKWNTLTLDIPEDFSFLDKIVGIFISPADATVGSYYLDNIYFSNERDTAPQDWLTPPVRDCGTYFSMFNDQPYGVTPEAESAFASAEYNSISGRHKISVEQYAQKIKIAGHGGLPFTLTNTQNLSSYTHLHFDIWPVDAMGTGEMVVSLYREEGVTDYKTSSSCNWIDNLPAQKWAPVDLKLSDFNVAEDGSTVIRNLSSFKILRFETRYGAIPAGLIRTYYIDNVYFYTPDIDPAIPQHPAFLPPVMFEANNLKTIFSDSYADNIPVSVPPQIIEVANNKVWKFTERSNILLALSGEPLDLSTNITHMHMDVWTQEPVAFKVTLNGITSAVDMATEAGKWLQLDIPVADFSGDLSAVTSFGLTGENTTYFIDNVYFYNDQPQFNVDINQYNADLGRGINLGTMFDHYETMDRYKPQYVEKIAELGFHHIRFPVRWEDYGRSLSEAPYNITPSFINKVREVVDKAVDENLKIILTMHHPEILQSDPKGQKERFLTQWKQIADYFRYYPDHVVFEVLNEPNDTDGRKITPELWNELLAGALTVIRVTNPNRPVLIGVAEFGGVTGLNKLVLPDTDQKLIVTIHYYNPMIFTHQGADWVDPVYPIGQEWLDSSQDRISVDNDFAIIEDYVQTQSRPIHIGEFGAINKADMDSRVRWTTYVARIMEQLGYSWAYWEYDYLYGIYDPELDVYCQPLIDALLKNPIPPEPVQTGNTVLETLYASELEGTSVFEQHSRAIAPAEGSFLFENNKIIATTINGGSETWHVQALKAGNIIEKDVTYRLTFTATSQSDYGRVYNVYLFEANSYIPYNEPYYYQITTTPTEHSFTFVISVGSDPNAYITFDLGGQGENEETITLEKIRLEKLDNCIQTAPAPDLAQEKVSNIYSSAYTNPTLTFSNPDLVSNVQETNHGALLLFSDFDQQALILETPINPEKKNMLHMAAYAGSPMELNVRLSGNFEQDEPLKFSLPSHEWTIVEFDLSDMINDEVSLETVTLSGGTGSGRKLYLDHMYFYKKSLEAISMKIEEKDNDELNIYTQADQIQITTNPQNPILELYIYDMQGHLIHANTSVNHYASTVRNSFLPAACIFKKVTLNGVRTLKYIHIL